MPYDGSLKFNTELDSSGFEKGLSELSAASISAMESVSSNLLSASTEYVEEKLRIEEKRAEQEEELAKAEYHTNLANAKNVAEAEKIKQEEILRLEKKADDSYLAELKYSVDKEQNQRDQKFKDLKYALDMQYITQDEYYSQLAVLRDTYFAEGSDEWQKYTVQIAKYNQKLNEKLLKEQEETAQKLTDYGSLYDTKTSTYKNAGAFGSDLVISETTLADLADDTKTLQKYADAIDALKSRGNVPNELLSELKEMNIDDGLLFADTLLSSSDKDFAAYIESYNQKLAESARIAAELSPTDSLPSHTSYISQASTLAQGTQNSAQQTDDVQTLIDDMSSKLETFYGTIPENFFTCGQNSAQKFKSGFLSQLESVFEEIQSAINAGMLSITPALSAAGINTSTSSYSASYNFYSSGETTSQQLAAAKAAATVERLRGGY